MEHDVGTPYASGRPQFLYAWETRLALGTPIEPGFQAYGQPSSFPGYNSGWPQDNRIGPQLFGTISNVGPGSIKWNGGILFGDTTVGAARNLALAGRIRNPFLRRQAAGPARGFGAFPDQASRSRRMRARLRCQSRAFSASRLSALRLPRASPSAILARPRSLK